jgi:hypothetical protein
MALMLRPSRPHAAHFALEGRTAVVGDAPMTPSSASGGMISLMRCPRTRASRGKQIAKCRIGIADGALGIENGKGL